MTEDNKKFIENLQKHIVVHIVEKYNDNDGPYGLVYYFEPDNLTELKISNFSNGYNNIPFDALSVNATEAQLSSARLLYRKQKIETNSGNCHVGCVVTLKNSKKLKNNTLSTILDYENSYFNSFGQHVAETIKVQQEDKIEWISINCIKDIELGVKPNF